MTALHLRITRDLAAQIRSGVWPPGHRIPFEHELMASYRCARATANKAVSALVDAGLIERRRRAGSFVTGPRLQSAALEIPDLEAEITRRGQIYAYELASRRLRPADGREPDEMRLAAAGDLLDLRGRHLADGRPFAIEHRVINLAAAPAASTADFSATAPGAWLMRDVAWSEAEHRIGAVAADAETAGGLGLDPGAACLALGRWTWRAGAGVTFARQVFPAGVLQLTARFVPKAFD